MNKKGFTLIELLVVISIIGLLSTLAVIALGNAREKARDARRMADIKQIRTALELYYNDNDGYPDGAASGDLIMGSTDAKCLENNTGFSDTCTGVVYMKAVPSNPNPGGTPYAYRIPAAATDNSAYELVYNLESGAGGISSGLHTATSGGIQ